MGYIYDAVRGYLGDPQALEDTKRRTAQGLDDAKHFAGRAIGTESVPTPEAKPADTAQADASRAQMQQFIAALQAQANGTGPSMAQGQLQQATDSNIHNAMAMGQSVHGMGYQAQLRNILQNQAMAQQQSAGQSALIRNQEMMQGQQMLGNAIAGTRGQDIQQSLGAQANQLNYDQMKYQSDASAADRGSKLLGTVINTGGAVVAKAHGGPIPGQALAAGDNHRNDTVPAMLSPGEIVLPRSVSQSEDAPDKAAAFVAAVKAQKQGAGDKDATIKKILERLQRVEQMACGGMVR